MKDRLEELKYRVREDDSSEFDESLAFDNPVYHEAEDNEMNVFFKEVSGLSSSVKKLRQLSDSIEKKQEEVLCSTTETDIYEGKKELSRIKNLLTSDAKVIQSHLNRMKGALGQSDKSWKAEHRIRQSQFTVLSNRYREVMTQHYIKETKYVGKLKEQIMRQAELAGLNLPEEEINQLIGSPVAPQIVGHDLEILKAKHHLAMAQERHKQLLDLEAQITELHSLFLQMDMLVSEQQEIVNSIEYNVLNTMDYISQSNEQVKKALKYERQSRVAALFSALLGLCACCTFLCCASRTVR
ncbi:syntaxin-1B-like [Spea bombifrons]|uniref:syntaxin-1B-like n=1 Tax=Spea bombifrons TaxID=233779 RepID=UPI0023492372|nr:syntaxin-1B-like [Spea bombifrons]